MKYLSLLAVQIVVLPRNQQHAHGVVLCIPIAIAPRNRLSELHLRDIAIQTEKSTVFQRWPNHPVQIRDEKKV